jgi:hypothetical protein
MTLHQPSWSYVFITAYIISAYHHERCEFESSWWREVLNSTLCDKVCQCRVAVRWDFSVSSTNKTDRYDIAEILFCESGVKHNKTNKPTVSQLYRGCVHITTNVVSSNPADGEKYWIQHYVIKFVSAVWQSGGFPRLIRFPPPIKLTATI